MFKKLLNNSKIVSMISLLLISINSWSAESEKTSLKNFSQAIGGFLFDAKIYVSQNEQAEIEKFRNDLKKIEDKKNEIKGIKNNPQELKRQNLNLQRMQQDLENYKKENPAEYKSLNLALKLKPKDITSINFELYNKSNQPIAFALYGKDKNGKNKILNPRALVNTIFPLGTGTKTEKQDAVQFENIDLNNTTLILSIWYPKPSQLVVEGKTPIIGTVIKAFGGSNNFFDPQPTFKYKFTDKFYNDLRQGKIRTAYLTFDAAGFGIRPQTGKLKGFSGTTETGLGLQFNIPVDNFKDYIINYDKSL